MTNTRDDIREAAEGIAVKPLRFEKQNVDGTLLTSELSIAGEYKVGHQGDHWLATIGMRVIGRYLSSILAIEAAQAHYTARIRSALDTGAIEAALRAERARGLEDAAKVDAERIEWMQEAMQETLATARAGRMDRNTIGSLSYSHIAGMCERVTPDFSASKLGRWLGWMQAAVVASGAATLDDMKDTNKRCSDAIRAKQKETGA